MFSIIIPIYNEEKNIEILLKEIKLSLKNYKNYQVVIIDDCSSDKSNLQVQNYIDNNIIENIYLLKNNKNRGQSYSINHGIKNSKFNTIITIDGDGQNNPVDIPKLLEFYLSHDEIFFVGGIRKNRKDSFIKIISSKLANFIRSRYLRDGCSDTGCSLKIFEKKIFLEFIYFDGIHRFLPALFKAYNYKTYFISVDHRYRKHGSSKYGTFDRLFRGIKDMIKVKKIINSIKSK
jgi:dolichol-phosphate mannosyltransferase